MREALVVIGMTVVFTELNLSNHLTKKRFIQKIYSPKLYIT